MRDRPVNDALLERAGKEPLDFAGLYERQRKKLDEVEKRLENARANIDSLSEDLKYQKREKTRIAEDLVKSEAKLVRAEEKAALAAELKSRVEEVEKERDTQREKLGELEGLMDTEAGQVALAMKRKLDRTQYMMYGGWACSAFLGVAIAAAYFLLKPVPSVPLEDDKERPAPPHRVRSTPVMTGQMMGVRRNNRLLLCFVTLAAVLAAAGAFTLVRRRQPRAASAPRLEPVNSNRYPFRKPARCALEFYWSGNRLWILNVVWAVMVPGLLAFSGFSARLRSVAARLGRVWFVTIGLYVLMYLAIVFVVDLPLAYYEGYVRLHAYGLSNQTLGKWFGDSVMRLAISMAAGVALAWVPYLLIARSPKRWWLYTAVLSVPFLFAVMLIKPIWIDPLFNRFGPMQDHDLEQQILKLARKAEIDADRVFEVEKSVDTKAVNAYVTGVFATKRIVLWDTLLAKLDAPEVLHVMGHEMGHYALGHVVRSIVLSVVLTLLGLFLVDWAGRKLIGRFPARLGFERLSDVASVPLVLMLLEIAMFLLTPVALAYSRHQEHEADKYALDLVGDNHSGALSFVKLMETNLSNPRPGPIYKFFRSSHPSIGERIDFCNSYRPRLSSESPSGVGASRSRSN